MSNYENLGWGVFTGKLGFFITKGTSNIDIDTEDEFLRQIIFPGLKNRFKNRKTEYSDIVKHLIDKNIDFFNVK